MTGRTHSADPTEQPTDHGDLRRLASGGVVAPMLTPSSALVVAIAAGAVTLSGLAYRFLRAPPDEDADASARTGSPALTEEERFVVDLLHERGGRVRQSEVVECSPWSKSKVSRLLTGMERDGYIRKVQVGRENAVVLADGAPDPTADARLGGGENGTKLL